MLEAILARLRGQPSRTGSLIMTLYGDAIAPRGGALWLGSLLALFRAIEVADGVVRTAVSRLAADGWLDRQRVGRNSFYRFTPRGLRDTEAAASRIYGTLDRPWGGRLRLALLDAGPEREAARAALAERGYGAAAPGLMIAPDCAAHVSGEGVVAMLAEAEPAQARLLAARAWPLDDLAARYRRFLEACPEGAVPDAPEAALVARVVLIHEWRRVVLRDPRLPAALLPLDWPGFSARARAARLYETLYETSERWLDAHGVTATGALPPAGAGRRRFIRTGDCDAGG
jgi:phenylacetic acid degradation operon negative regulatory protein